MKHIRQVTKQTDAESWAVRDAVYRAVYWAVSSGMAVDGAVRNGVTK